MSLDTRPPREWPVVLYAPDLKEIFRCSLRSAQRKMKAGKCGPCRMQDGKLYVLRDDFIKILGGEAS